MLCLDPGMEQLAKAEQREAMESDEREGLVCDYLDMLLPVSWDGASAMRAMRKGWPADVRGGSAPHPTACRRGDPRRRKSHGVVQELPL